ncbi:hypothetical protein [Haloferula sp. A504]|uniref:hypothetical protein n=1 Tax=Haloferula sp. A504 TaxID=3373601 RepID=UPI0031C97D73|nr:hypothetical protein [Verrucomicrobiaceae bacterium E54]
MSQLPSGLSAEVDGGEPLARYCTSSSWVAKSKGRVKYQAFMPAPDDDTSVYRSEGMSDGELWAHADRYFVNAEGEPYRIHGAAVVEASCVSEAGIQIIPDEGPPRHANLRGWPLDADLELQKSKRKAVAKRIASEAKWHGKG